LSQPDQGGSHPVLLPALFSGPLAAGGMPESTQQHPGGSQEAGLLQGLPQPTSLQERKSPLISTLTLQVASFFFSVKSKHNMERGNSVADPDPGSGAF
jgi:hypothetical protein